MKRGMIWGGFGALLLVGVLSGYVPDLMLASQLRGARVEGLVAPAERVEPKRDARLAYEAAAKRYADGWNLLGNDFARQVKTPAPHVVKYLESMAEASRLPECSAMGEGWDGAYYGRTEADVVARAAKALAVRADDEASLLAAARVTRHLGAQGGPLLVGHWAVLVPQVLARAAKLGIAPGSVVAALGPPVSPREALRRHVAEETRNFERAREKGGSVSVARRETAYLRFWRGFLARHPEGDGFVEALRGENLAIDGAENSVDGYVDLSPVMVAGPSPDRWAAWAKVVERANARLKAGR